MGLDAVVASFEAWGYSILFRLAIGALEVLAGLALLFPVSARAGALALIPVMAGAVYTHVFRGTWLLASLIPITVLLLLAIVAARPYVERSVTTRPRRTRRASRDGVLPAE